MLTYVFERMNPGSKLRYLLVFLVLVLGMVKTSYATHLRAGEITVERVSCNSLTFRITVTVFTNTINTNVLFGGTDDYLDFGDGSDDDGDGIPGIKVPETQNIDRPELGEGVATASFTIVHTFPGYQEYLISYNEPNRNAGVVNMDASVTTRFYIETKLIVDPFLGCNNTPKLLVPPIDKACTGVAWFHNPGAYDPDGDSLSYRMVIPLKAENTTVTNYQDPNASKFYQDPNNGSEIGGPPSFAINPIDGTITWDAPGMSGEYNIAFEIVEWRNVKGQWVEMGFVRRDMQILVDDCDNERPDLEIPEDVCVVAGTTLTETIFGIDPDGDDVRIEAFSEIFNLAPAQSPATYSPKTLEFQPTDPKAELQFTWNTECLHVKEQPYAVVFKITDQPKSGGTRLVTFKTWFIRVVGPEPEWVNATLIPATRSTQLEWDPYICQNADSIEVWRRVDSFAFEPDSCQTGMPEFLGYTKIKTLAVKTNGTPTTGYLDNNNGLGLASGAQYCYRLVATFPPPRGGESYVSDEICIGPILADRPIITNVTVDKTDDTNGEITIKWREPFEADPVQFPPPYTYDVYRAIGAAGDAGLTKITPTPTTLLTYTDATPNTDSESAVYNYRVIAYASDGAPLDYSATASTVRLDAESQLNKIQLTWSAFVPWSNQRQQTPNKHVIFRGDEGDTDAELVQIAEVDVTSSGFIYVDEGQHNGEALVPGKTYCYKVMTRGGYGNPQIAEPLENFSQMICAQPGDEDAPCIPETPLTVNALDCNDPQVQMSLCNINVFENILKWNRPEDPLCRADISFYRIYAAANMGSTDEQYIQIGETRDTVFTYNALSSFATCYKITAVDRSNNESEKSEAVCFDNCPYYELPNVFTPNGDDCNKVFRAYSNKSFYYTSGEEAEPICGAVVDETKCARFVSSVIFKVFNRWGKEVYAYKSGGERTIYIDWDGKASDGSDLASGVYYYVADVTYVTVDPSKRNKTIKGWVHLIR